jgi:osmotically-inducible protein OsmY
MTDDDLRRDVAAELSWDPKVGSHTIVVSADADVVTLRGTVGTLREKLEAGRAAGRVYGITEVSNQLHVRTPDGGTRDATDLRGDVLDALMLDSLIPMTVDAKARDGRVTLTGRSAVLHARELSAETISYGTVILAGTVNSWAEHREAVAAAWSAPGVTEIDDQIVVEY